MHGKAVAVLPCEKVKQEALPWRGLSKAEATFVSATLIGSLVPAEEVPPGEEGPVFVAPPHRPRPNPLGSFEKLRRGNTDAIPTCLLCEVAPHLLANL